MRSENFGRAVTDHRLPACNWMHNGDANAFVPSSIVGLIADWTSARWCIPFGRFYHMMVKSTLQAVAGPQRTGTSVASSQGAKGVFPMPLPFRDVLEADPVQDLKPLERRRRRKHVSAKQLTNLLVALACFYEAECPRGGRNLVFATSELTDAQKSALRGSTRMPKHSARSQEARSALRRAAEAA